jgi:hypothetical protein
MATISCDPNDLQQAAACYKCIPTGAQAEVMIYLLAVLAGGSLDPNTLMQEASCMRCIPAGMQDEVITYLLCQIVNQ